MSKVNCARKGCKDVFNAFLVKMAVYAGLYEFPAIKPTYDIPSRLVSFSRCRSTTDYNQWVHFYEDDYLFECLWKTPQKYLSLLQQFDGVILPDFSLYRDMPLVMQLWNIYRSRAIGFWLQSNGVKVIPNIRYGDYRTFKCCCDGISRNSVIAIGSHGTLKNKVDRVIFEAGLAVVIKILQPKAIIIYGSAPDSIFQRYRDRGIVIYQYESEFSKAMKQKKEMV